MSYILLQDYDGQWDSVEDLMKAAATSAGLTKWEMEDELDGGEGRPVPVIHGTYKKKEVTIAQGPMRAPVNYQAYVVVTRTLREMRIKGGGYNDFRTQEISNRLTSAGFSVFIWDTSIPWVG